VVVAVGLTLVEPLGSVEVNVPGVIARLVAPAPVQLNVLLAPLFMLVGFAVKEVIVGTDTLPEGELDAVPPQPASPTQARRTITMIKSSAPGLHNERVRRMSCRVASPSGFVCRNRIVVIRLTPSDDSLLPTASWL
jgi:hypothetical protein